MAKRLFVNLEHLCLGNNQIEDISALSWLAKLNHIELQ
jgi:Leucine-rich repeat (LRR) protein